MKQEGNTLFAKGKYSAAIEAYTEARMLCPKWEVPLVNRALCHRKRSDWSKVAEDCIKALEIDPDLPKAHYMLGLALLEEHKHEEAVTKLTKALEMARDRGATMLDEIWRELARAKLAVWSARHTQQVEERERLQERSEQALRHCAATELQQAQVRKESVEQQEAVEKGLEVTLESLKEVFRQASKDDTPEEIPDWCICKLTMEPFRDPIVTPCGFTYERSALFEHFDKLGHFDPVTREKIDPRQCVSNIALRKATQAYLDKHGWAWGECAN
eukprot:CAMPEP_0196586860 /NCGR_PEP_ID=MMETSP1081-20130531/55823_1 /TAXON_ID=36882 /ORGANISM="Pyramimonas amylifera, Strain CCMP720" /LENGTH=271 /DNA_ID=CAMNT_0041908873 /DNA_START=234 /DNA_END=1049 /DNA_ORIENTATION=+